MAQPGLALQEGERRFLHYHRRLNHSQRTLEHYQDSFALFRRYLTEKKKPALVGLLTTSTLASFQTWLAETPMPRSYRGDTRRTIGGIHGIMKDLRAFAYWLAEEELLERPPKVALPKLPQGDFRIFTEDELAQLFGCRQLTGRSDGAVRNRALVALLLDSGIRLSEIANLTFEDLYLEDGLAKVRGKGSKVRHVPFTAGTAAYRKEWLTLCGPETPTLFGLTHHGVKMLMRRLARESGIKVHCHKFRHTSATMMVQSNMDLHSVKRVLGHSHLSVTEKYLSLSNEDLRQKHAAASPMNRLQARLDASPEKPRRRRYNVG